MKKYLLLVPFFFMHKTFAQNTNQDDVKKVNAVIIAYFSKIAEIGINNSPYQNAVSGFYRQAIAEDGAVDDSKSDPKRHEPNGPVTSLSNATVSVTDENAEKLLTVFSEFSKLNQKAFINNRNHYVDRLSLQSVFGEVSQDWADLTAFGSSIVDLFVSSGTDIDGWIAVLASIQKLAADSHHNKKLGGGDNAANGYIARDVNIAGKSALQILNQCNFDEQSLEGKTKKILNSFFINLDKVTSEYENRHNNWLNPGWQFDYSSIMDATAIAISNLNNCSTVSVLSTENSNLFEPKTYTKKLITTYTISKLKNGGRVGDFVYYIDTTEVTNPLNYTISFKTIQEAKLCNSDRTVHVSLNNINLTSNEIQTNEQILRSVNMTVSRRTYNKLYRVHKKEAINWAISKEESNKN